MKIKIEPTRIEVTITMTPMEADLLQGRAQLAHEKFEGDSGDDHFSVMKQLANTLKLALTGYNRTITE